MSEVRSFKGGLVSGLTLLTLGLVFLLDNFGLVDLSVMWPMIPIGIGVGLILRYYLSPQK